MVQSVTFHAPLVPNVRFMTARGWNFRWRKLTSAVELTFLEAGGTEWRVGRWSGVRLAGSLSIVPAGELAVGTRVLGPGDFFNVEIERDSMDGWPLDSRQVDGGPARDAMSELAARVRDEDNALGIEIALEQLKAALAGDDREPIARHADRVPRRIRDVLHDRSAESLSLSDVADAARVSRFHAVRVFRAAYGVTPFEYLVHLRLQHAATALREGQRPVDVALDTGFTDQAHLTRWFARMFKVTPGAFARAHAVR